MTQHIKTLEELQQLPRFTVLIKETQNGRPIVYEWLKHDELMMSGRVRSAEATLRSFGPLKVIWTPKSAQG